jgi:signal transduction histidine kinase/CheY-like chemotaxis protein
MAFAPDIEALILQGHRLRQVDPQALRSHAQRLQQLAAGDVLLQGYAEVFNFWGLLANGDRPAAEQALARAEPLMARSGDNEGCTVCRGLHADLFIRDGRFAEAVAICDDALAQPEHALSISERYRASSRRTTALERAGDYDESLRAHYQSIALARRADDAAMLASALGGAGGLQSSLLNLVDAATLCDEAWALCAHSDWHNVIQLAGINRMGALSGLGRHDEALAMAEALLARESAFPPRQRKLRHGLYALTMARVGDYARAQHYLDIAHGEQRTDMVDWSAWSWIQAMVHNRTGRPAEALAVLAPYLERRQDVSAGGDFPVDHANLLNEAALACEALGDHASALTHERTAAALREQAAAKAAHARRLTLQIDYELDAAHRARDDALREQERATREQQRLADLNAQLEAANAAKTRFLAAASHDLRQPVQALTMYMAALQREPAPTARADLMARMNHSLQSLGTLFDVLLDVSRLDAGVVPVHLVPLRLDALLQRLADEHRLAATQRGLQLRLRLPARPAWTLSDAALLEGCVRNLLDNAQKYTPRGGVVLRLRAHGAHWRIEVADTGLGIDAAQQPMVFHEFYQVDNEDRDRRKGLGLGLSIVARTTTLLGHPLGLRSRPGRGSRFHIDVPDEAMPPPEDIAQADLLQDARTLCLAVVDDDVDVRDSLALMLERWGHRVVAGSDDAEVLLLWQRLGCPTLDAAIVDLRLRGGRTGLQSIDALRGRVRIDMPALVLTGDTAPERLRLLADAGLPWLPKPLMPLRLRSWLQAACTAPRRS